MRGVTAVQRACRAPLSMGRPFAHGYNEPLAVTPSPAFSSLCSHKPQDQSFTSMQIQFDNKMIWDDESTMGGSPNPTPTPMQSISNPEQQIRRTPFQSDFTLGPEVGSGFFARVYRATANDTGHPVAVKVIKKRVSPLYKQEMLLQSRVNHPSVVPLLAAYETDDEMLLVTPFYSGCDLYDYAERTYESGGRVPEEEALVLASQMLTATESVHKEGIVHLDVKMENFMFSEEEHGGHLVLLDFGSAEPMKLRSYADSQDGSSLLFARTLARGYNVGSDDSLLSNRVTGTGDYLSPEAMLGQFSSRSDVFGVGVSLYTLLTGLSPFAAGEQQRTNTERIRTILKTQESIFEWKEWDGVTAESTDIVRWMLRADPHERCSTSEALSAIKTCLAVHETKKQHNEACRRFNEAESDSVDQVDLNFLSPNISCSLTYKPKPKQMEVQLA